MGRRFKSEEFNVWPVVADSFLGILGVIVLLFIGVVGNLQPPEPKIREFLQKLEKRLSEDEKAGVLQGFRVTRESATIVYPEKTLSFDPCKWDLPEDKASIIRDHLSLFGSDLDLVERIQIEGHADARSARNCPSLVFGDNFELSQNRARAVLDALLNSRGQLDSLVAGADACQAEKRLHYICELVRNGKVLVAGYGASRPYPSLDRAVRYGLDHPIHRRVEITLRFKSSPVTLRRQPQGGG